MLWPLDCFAALAMTVELTQQLLGIAQAGIQGPGTCGQVWMPAFAGMTLTFLSYPLTLNNSCD